MPGDTVRDGAEDRDSAVARALLSTVEPPAGRLTSSGLLARGRRVRRRRRSTATVAGVLLLGLATVGGIGLADADGADEVGQPPPAESVAAQPGPCTVEALALPARATTGDVNDGSPSGRYLVGFATVDASLPTPVRWDGTKAESITIDGSGEAQGVNDSGVVVGKGQRASGQSFAWAYVGGKVIELPVPPGYTGAEATAVNAQGDVAGVLFKPHRTAAVVWRGTGVSARADVLAAPSGAAAFGISDAGVVVGALQGSDSVPYQWNADGLGSRLSALTDTVGGGVQGIRGDWAYGLLFRESEEVPAGPGRGTAQAPSVSAGSSADQSPIRADPTVAVLWNLATGQAAAVEGGRIEAVNTRGEAVVNHTADRTASLQDPVGTVRELPGLTTGAPASAYALDETGLLAAGTSGSAPVRWQCRQEEN